MRAPAGQVAVGAGVAAIGALILGGSFFLPTGGGYAQVGPGVVPRVVGGILIVLGVLLLREAFTGGFSGVDEEAEARLPMDWPAFAWVSGGIIASTVLFVMVARGFNSRRWLGNAITGLVLAIVVFVIFNYGLGLTLPAGVLAPLLK
ncbi:MAG TPA: tripartite tricarboxylate transporter TctB family protein [Usitatibacter sp.]|nr:tripartite tricarboxylate transporter TctB family protein [Usitatibacter sp.]